MNSETRLTELLRDTADAHTPPDGLGRIQEKAGGLRRARRIRRVAIPAVVAVIVAAIAVPLALRGGKHHSQRIIGVPAPTTAVPSPEPTTPQAPAPSPKPVAAPPSTAFRGPPGGPVPPGFLAASVTFVSPSKGWVLGSAPCPSAPCTSIVRTTDGGHTWNGIPAPRTPLGLSSDDPASVAFLRFANDRDGFAFDNALWTTHDGGAHWHQVPAVAGVSPYSVPSLAATPDGVYAIVQGVAPGGGGDGHYRLVRGDSRGNDFSVVHDFGPHTGVVDMTASGTTVYVTFSSSGSDTVALARIQGSTFVTRALPDPSCGTPAPSSAADLLLQCGQGLMAGGQGTRTLYGTTNGGDTWTRLPDPGRGAGWTTTGVADAGGGHAVIATSDAGGAGLLATTDGAQHWVEALHLSDTGGEYWGDLGFENRSTGVVVLGPNEASASQQGRTSGVAGAGALYRTVDGGATWSKVSFSA